MYVVVVPVDLRWFLLSAIPPIVDLRLEAPDEHRLPTPPTEYRLFRTSTDFRSYGNDVHAGSE
jgi:hypothetical protein